MEEFRELLDRLEIINDGTSLLHLAAYCNNVVVTDCLIKLGCDVDVKNDEGITPLDCAIKSDSIETAELLLKAGASFTSGLVGTDLGSLFHLAAACGSVKMVNWIIKGSAGDCNVKNHHGHTPLMYAIIYSKVNVVKVLIEAGSDLNNRDSDGVTPLILSTMKYKAGSNESYEIVKVLIEAGSNVNVADNNDITALHRAGITDKDFRLIPLLLQNGAEVNAVGFNGLLPIHAAITADNYRAAEALIKAGSRIDCSVQNNITILHYAMRFYEPKIIKLLLEKGALLHAVNDDDLEPFIYGIMSLHFLPNDNVLSIINKDFETCLQSKFKCLKLLLKQGADINRVSSTAGTALNVALESDKMDSRAVSFLLNNKAIIDFNDKAVQDALSSLEKQEILRLLIKHVALCEMQSHSNDQIKNFDLDKMPQEIQDYYRSCKTELEEMKKWEIVKNEFTLNDILIAKKISHYVRNENALQVIEKVSSMELFPIYIEDLRRRFKKEAKKQKRLDEARNGLSRLIKREVSSFVVVYDNILRFLSKNDLHNLSLI